MSVTRVRSRNATFQYWQTLLTNRNKRGRSRELVVQGVRPTDLALAAHTPIRSLLVADAGTRSRWAQEVADHARAAGAAEYLLELELLGELGEQEDRTPELLITVEIPQDDPARIQTFSRSRWTARPLPGMWGRSSARRTPSVLTA